MSFKLPNNTIKWNSAPSVARYHLIDDLQESLVSLPLEANSRASSLVLLETLPTEIVSLICEWLQAKDLILLSCSCKSLYYAQSGKIDHHVIRDHLFRRLSDMWRAPDKMVHSLIATLSLQQIAQLIPLAKPLISGVRSDSSELCCSGNSALFLGHVGLGSRSVVACQPLPALDLAAASNELLPTSFMRSVCNAFGMLTCRQPSAYSAERCEGDFSFPLSLPLPLPLSFARLTSMGTSSSSDESPSQRLVSSASFAPSCSFSTPFLLGDKLLVAPRCVCYFEVSVVEVPVSEVVSGGLYGQANNDHGQGGGNGEGECVAVGLATRHFRGASKMPGWDANSFGLVSSRTHIIRACMPVCLSSALTPVLSSIIYVARG